MSANVTIEQALLESLRQLPVEQQKEVLDFAEFLKHKTNGKTRSLTHDRRNPIGLFAHLNLDISDVDIAEARREMWSSFPRDVEL